MTSKESREWAASVEQSRQQVVADRLASITHWRMVQARNERRKMYPYRSDAAQRGSKTMNAKTCKVLSIKARADGDDGWTWNMRYNEGTVTLDIDSDEDAILAAMVDEGLITQTDSVMVEDDGYNLVICDEGTGEPLFAIEYGSEV